MSDLDTMRWGDTVAIPLVQAQLVVGEGEGVYQTQQILNAVWQRPVVWRLLLSAKWLLAPEDVGSSVTIAIYLRVGVGQANQEIPLTTIILTMETATGFIQPQFFDVPAEALQVAFQVVAVTSQTGNAFDPNSILTVTGFVAPHAEPGSLAQIRDNVKLAMGDDPKRGPQDPDRRDLPRWMPPGFDDGEVRYRY